MKLFTQYRTTHLDRPLIYLHLPQTGGSTIKLILKRNLKEANWKKIVSLGKEKPREISLTAFSALPQSEIDLTQVIVGHIPFGLHKCFSKPCNYITLLRHPLRRIISQYYQMMYKTHKPYYDTIRGLTLKDFVLSDRNAVSNIYVKLLSNTDPREYIFEESGTPLSSNALETAKQNILEHFSTVGILERFDETLLVLQNDLNLRSVYYANQSVNPSRPKYEDIPRELLTILERKNQLDLELYEFATHLFEKRIQEYGPSFQRDLARFRKINALLQQTGVAQVIMASGKRKKLILLADFYSHKIRQSLARPAAKSRLSSF